MFRGIADITATISIPKFTTFENNKDWVLPDRQ